MLDIERTQNTLDAGSPFQELHGDSPTLARSIS